MRFHILKKKKKKSISQSFKSEDLALPSPHPCMARISWTWAVTAPLACWPLSILLTFYCLPGTSRLYELVTLS